MKKEYIYGGLAVIAILGVLAYTRKPHLNSDSFFSADGVTLSSPPKTVPPPKQITVGTVPINCNLPDTFTKKVYTDRGMKSFCGRYDRLLTNKGFIYRLQPQLNWNKNDGTGGQYPFINGNFYNLSGGVIATNPTVITYQDFENAWIHGEFCK